MEEEQKKSKRAAALPKVGWKGMLALAFGILFLCRGFCHGTGARNGSKHLITVRLSVNSVR